MEGVGGSSNQRWYVYQLAKYSCGEDVARDILTSLSTDFGIPNSHLVAVMRDSVAVNNSTDRTTTIMYPTADDIGCFPHILSHIGGNFQVPILTNL